MNGQPTELGNAGLGIEDESSGQQRGCTFSYRSEETASTSKRKADKGTPYTNTPLKLASAKLLQTGTLLYALHHLKIPDSAASFLSSQTASKRNQKGSCVTNGSSISSLELGE
ncbi:hypothetical protein BVRB_3g069210 isoform A [Beta vulgaris subsp. vulgaris]|uniref:uncharacterized protein LOC104906797 isoform X1 n=1 Tax=Beta vulgaris subsp. vulgaris TaxID=3555 RepID=UPI00053FF28F|nr:uncharacterized protein LOC104906797 isoform X1 [Beta vulgaris subsp. vulgaris]XP_010693913.1 uncharacterized protein LOC104906797 isoform X1 [Beta vulgaris subsp. vulgaris]XP_019108016.1 uncharacterized protein LOC104906797 isoform X1 [Beta vulgaris subsp. vulgaris]XP_019108017.1 uncharacterized protein LOC104906797 isoform X1 [Beta vulgaris subsp. vulgaris]XP_048497262.1 uncharacterized protein LOC104906797 isoform X1 [Beta vulgaris subsp. vulgaris]XP_057249656.1 uncharacterized protein L